MSVTPLSELVVAPAGYSLHAYTCPEALTNKIKTGLKGVNLKTKIPVFFLSYFASLMSSGEVLSVKYSVIKGVNLGQSICAIFA